MDHSSDKEHMQINNSDHYTEDRDDEQLVENSSRHEGKTEMSQLNVEENKSKEGLGGLKIIVVSSIVFAVAVTVALIFTIYFGPSQVPRHGAVSTNAQVCANIGTQIIVDGGTTVDSVVATAFCEAVLDSHLCGLGGGGFVVLRDVRKSKTYAYDFYDAAPKISQENAKIAVPGFVAGLRAIHGLFGKLDWQYILEPTIKLARDGFNVTQSFVEAYEEADVDLSDLFAEGTDMSSLAPGDVVRMPRLAKLIQQISDQGQDAFYTGDNAGYIRTASNNEISRNDLSDYKTIKRATISSNFHGYRIDTLPAPSGGNGLIFMLDALTAQNISSGDARSTQYYHKVIEAAKYMNAQYNQFGDRMSPNVTTILQSADTLATIREATSEEMTADSYTIPGLQSAPALPDYSASIGNIHIAAIGTDDFIVSMSLSLGSLFGSKIITESGVLLNDHLKDFTDEEGPNSYEPGKRPQSYLAPAIAYHPDKPCGLRLATGGSATVQIPTVVAEVMTNHIVGQMKAQEAIKALRVVVSDDSTVEYEEGIDEAIVADLQSIGHHSLQQVDATIGAVSLTSKVNETIYTHNDERIHAANSTV